MKDGNGMATLDIGHSRVDAVRSLQHVKPAAPRWATACAVAGGGTATISNDKQ